MLLKMKRMLVIILALAIFSGNVAFAATIGEQNALRSAKQYLEIMSFSYVGLIEQLEYDGYTNAEARYAANICFERNTVTDYSQSEEEFSFRNDIRFGDTIDTVQSKEELDLTKNQMETGMVILTSEKTTLSTIPNAYLKYFFDDGERLSRISIQFPADKLLINDLLDNYDMIEEGLTRKYGDNISSIDGRTDFVSNDKFPGYMAYTVVNMLEGFGIYGTGCLNEYSQWYVQYKKGVNIVEHLVQRCIDGDNSIYSHEVNYLFYNNEWFEDKHAEKQSTQNSIDSDL